MSRARHLVVFVRTPVMGRAKSRLARGIGWVAATRFYRQETAALLRRLGRGRWRRWLAVVPDRAAPRWPWPKGWARLDQGQGDLGRRMGRVFQALPTGPVVIVGSDIPDLAADHVSAAFLALGRGDAVFGPAADGGYWLVGLTRRPRRPDPRTLFRSVRWSGPHALADSRKSLPAGARVALLEVLEDIDEPADLGRLKARRRLSSPCGRARAPAGAA